MQGELVKLGAIIDIVCREESLSALTITLTNGVFEVKAGTVQFSVELSRLQQGTVLSILDDVRQDLAIAAAGPPTEPKA